MRPYIQIRRRTETKLWICVNDNSVFAWCSAIIAAGKSWCHARRPNEHLSSVECQKEKGLAVTP